MQEGAPTLRILQLSDIHLDENYAVGSNTDCGEPLCCRASHGSPSTPSAGAVYWGEYRDCDIPPRTFDSLLNHLRTGEKVILRIQQQAVGIIPFQIGNLLLLLSISC